MQPQPRPGINMSDAASVMDADASHVISTRCAIHGIEMDCQQGNTYFCAECLGLADERHSNRRR
jgi:hypothetical protein